jgi:hypothetical protein
MKVKVFTILVILALAFAIISPSNVSAQAYTTSFTTSITYQNVDTAPTTVLNILFYATPSTVTPITIPQPSLASGASTSVYVGGLADITPPFKGSAIIQSDKVLLATLVQLPQNSTTVVVRPLSNGFSDGTDTALIATVLKNTFGATSIFSIQNIDTVTNTVDIKFFDTGANMLDEIIQNVEPGASYYVDAGTRSLLGTSFSGSVVATATKTVGGGAGKIVGSAMELDITGIGAKAFESVSAGANTIYMPSALCQAFGSQITSYAVQNTSLVATAHVTVTFNPGGLTATADIGPGSKASFPACNTVAAGFSGSAVVTSTGAPVVAMGKASGGGLSTAFLGAPSGSAKVAMPYVRWAPDANYNAGSAQRTFIAIQNVGGGTIPANSITLTYTDSFGHSGTHTYGSDLVVGAKFNSNASNAGLTWFGMATPPAAGFGGGVTVNCSAPSCQIIAVARVATFVPATSLIAAEDYNAMTAP